MRDNEIDNQIDEAARRLTAGEPGGDLRARVLNRIDAGRASWFGRAGWMWIAASALATLVVAVSVHEVHGVHGVQQVQGVQHVQQIQGVQQVQQVQQVQILAEHPANLVNPVNPMPEAESLFAPARLEIAPLSIAPALVEAIPPAPPIVVADLEVAPIDVRAIDETVAPDALTQ
jgi:hypothetical protein